MGSYLSILNNTDNVWSVKIGPDEAAINIASTTSMVLAVGSQIDNLTPDH